MVAVNVIIVHISDNRRPIRNINQIEEKMEYEKQTIKLNIHIYK